MQSSSSPFAFHGLRLEKLKRALLGLVARLHEVLERLLAQGVLLSADDAALVLHQVGLGQAAGCVLGGAVENLGLGAHRRCLSRLASLRYLASLLRRLR